MQGRDDGKFERENIMWVRNILFDVDWNRRTYLDLGVKVKCSSGRESGSNRIYQR